MIPPDAAIRSPTRLVERFNWVWIWMGDPARADPAHDPDFHWSIDPPIGPAKPDYLHVACNWQLVNDNLLDLTHLVYVHESTIGNMALGRDCPATPSMHAELRAG